MRFNPRVIVWFLLMLPALALVGVIVLLLWLESLGEAAGRAAQRLIHSDRANDFCEWVEKVSGFRLD